MAFTSVIPILLIAVITRCACQPTSEYNNNNNRNGVSSFGEILKPPPPPQSLSKIIPVPFHGGTERLQRQNQNVGYHYHPPLPSPSPSPVPILQSNEFKFPAPFYKQYNFNFVPPPQPFTTTVSPSFFQKVSGWLFPSQQTSYDLASQPINNNNVAVKKDCNPCNLVPWIPVIRYNLGAKNVQHNSIPTYGPPSPTAVQSAVPFRPQPFHPSNQQQQYVQNLVNITPLPYEPPTRLYHGGPVQIPHSTYGPPSPTHTITHSSPNIQSSTYSESSSPFHLEPPSSISSSSNSLYKNPNFTHNIITSSQNIPSSSYNTLSSSYGVPSTTHKPPESTYGPPSPSYGVLNSNTPDYKFEILNNNRPEQSDVEILKDVNDLENHHLPKVSYPTGFKNSYGETITGPYGINVPFSVSAADESTKIKTQVLPHDGIIPTTHNISLALANPAPFTLNKGRNIHTLQPVALPNLSVSPLPPIFNARPFRPLITKLPTNYIQGINYMQQVSNNVNIEQSVPIELTHSVEYPPTVIQSPIIDIDASKSTNHSKAYRNMPTSYNMLDNSRDITSLASEDHISATKSKNDASFESTGVDFGNELLENGFYTDNDHNTNHKISFADLRGMKDEDIDKYRTESNLQSIDSPLLYLKPSAPHKGFGNFHLTTSTSLNTNDYEMYDDIPTTPIPYTSTVESNWDKGRTDYIERLPAIQEAQENRPKVVQIIIPYTSEHHHTNNDSQRWTTPEDNLRARKVPSNTDNSFNIIVGSITESSTMVTTTEEPTVSVTDDYNKKFNTPTVVSDLYDVKEPPFDIIKLQHNIDDWTEQQYSKHYRALQTPRNDNKYAKKIPDEFFTTASPITNYVTENINYEFYDHEGSSSIQHSITENRDNTVHGLRKEYKVIQRNKSTINKIDKKPHIYTASSSFRTTATSTTTTTTTTPAPWATIQTSISPLTKEKIYVVTSKPWREPLNETTEWDESIESKKTRPDNYDSVFDNLPFKSPRFSNRPSVGFTSGSSTQLQPDSSYRFSKSWFQRINELETLLANNNTTIEVLQQKDNTYSNEDTSSTSKEDSRT